MGQTNGPNFSVQETPQKSRNQPTKQPAEGTDLRKNASRRPSACLAFPALTPSLGSITDILNCNCGCAYANEFPVAVEDLDVDKLRTIAQGAVDLMRGYKIFGCLVTCRVGCTSELQFLMQNVISSSGEKFRI